MLPIFSKLKEKIESYKRVMLIAKKPNIEELKYTAKICGIGILVVGLIGFIVYILAILFLG